MSKRHVTYTSNIALILSLDGDHIKQKTLCVIKKYSKLLDVKKISIMLCCIYYNIKVKLIFYKMTNDDINSIINVSIYENNKYYLNYIDNNINVINFIGEDKFISLLHEISDMNLNNFVLFIAKRLQIDNSYDDGDSFGGIFNKRFIVSSLCTENMQLNIIKPLHKIFKLTGEDFQSNDDEIMYNIRNNNRVDIVKYLHKKCDNICYYNLIRNNNKLDIFRYLYEEIKLSKDDFKLYFRSYEYEHLEIFKYLYEKIKLTKEDFQMENNNAFKWVCKYGCIEIVKYLHQEIGLTKEDLQSQENNKTLYFDPEDSKYLHEHIGLTFSGHKEW